MASRVINFASGSYAAADRPQAKLAHNLLEIPDRLSPQNQVLQELTPVCPGLLGHVRKPFIRVAVQEDAD